jgi:malonyl CoA-acyl carrier protein transacylase
VASLLVLDAVERLGIEPNYCAGHSLGEYTALAATGALALDDGVLLVCERADAMHDAGGERLGTMAAVLGLDDDDVEVACRRADDDVWVANFNAPGQVVIAGSPSGVERATAEARTLGAKKVMPLQVSGAFHTPFMAPARDRLRQAIAAAAPRDTEVPIVSNVDALPHVAGHEWTSLLSAQLSSPVRWKHCLLTLSERGVTGYVELGPGGVLTGMAKRTVPTARTTSVATPDDLDRLLEWVGAGTVLGRVELAGEHLFATERLVVSPSAGIFAPVPDLADGARIHVGTVVGHVGSDEVRSAVRRGAAGVHRRQWRAGHGSPADHLAEDALMPAVPSGVNGAQLTGWGAALPDRVVSNEELSRTLDTSDAWIRERTGIHERRVGGSTAELSVRSGRAAMERAGIEPRAIDVLVLATTTPDRMVPATSATVQHELGLRCGAFDLNAACSGFVYGLVTAYGLIGLGAERALVIGTDTLSRITDWTDRNTAVLFADGSAAVVLEATDGPGDLLAWDLDADGSAEGLLYADHGGHIQMEGKEVFRRAVRVMVDSAEKSLQHAGLTADDISLVVPHQANLRIIEAALDRLGVPMERAAHVLHRTGNTSSASIPLALVDAADAGRLSAGDRVLLVGFGAGMTAASAVLRWGAS